MKKIKYLNCLNCILIICIIFIISGCSKKQEACEKTSFLFDTVVKITIFDKNAENALNGCFELGNKYETMFSKTVTGSDIWNINHSNGEATVVSDDTIAILKQAVSCGERSEGIFDVSIGSVSGLWDFNSPDPVVPDEKLIKKATEAVDYKKIDITEHTIQVPAGMQLDLGGIAKGYIADRMKEYLLKQNVSSAIISLGGNILLVGDKDGDDFTVGIQKPFSQTGDVITTVSESDCSIVTSGTYERCFTIGDKLYHHILDPKTGYPCETDLNSVTIISKKSADGDALSTICLFLGRKKGMDYIQSIPDVSAIFVTKDNQVFYSSR